MRWTVPIARAPSFDLAAAIGSDGVDALACSATGCRRPGRPQARADHRVIRTRHRLAACTPVVAGERPFRQRVASGLSRRAPWPLARDFVRVFASTLRRYMSLASATAFCHALPGVALMSVMLSAAGRAALAARHAGTGVDFGRSSGGRDVARVATGCSSSLPSGCAQPALRPAARGAFVG